MPLLRRSSLMLLLAALASLSVAAAAVPIHDETVDGDLSGDRLAPTDLALAAGVNSVSATTVAGDVDYFHVSLPAGLEIEQIVLAAYDSGFNFLSFIAVQEGTTFSVPSTTVDPSSLLGWNHFNVTQVGSDILDDIAGGFGAIGFTPPLAGSDYVFWLNETGGLPATYTLDFVVVPEPASVLLLGLGLTGLVGARRR